MADQETLDPSVGDRLGAYGADMASKLAVVHNAALAANALPMEDLELLREVYWFIRENVMD